MRLFIAQRGRKKAAKYIAIFCICIALILLSVFIVRHYRTANFGSDATRNAIALAEYDELNAALSVFDTIGYPNADLLGNILPTLHLHFHSAEVLDELLVSQYGEEYRLLDTEVYRYINLTMQEIESAATQGESTALGVENMTVYMMILRENLSNRFDLNGNVQPLG